MKTHAIVTGAAGILGQAVTQALTQAGYKVTGIDRADSAGAATQGTYLGGIDLTDSDATATAVNQAINAMDQITQQNAAMVEEANAASQALTQEAASIAAQLSAFRTSGEARPAQGSGYSRAA